MLQDNNYGLRGMQKFVQMAEAVGICVRQPVAVTKESALDWLLQQLRDIRYAKFLIAFLAYSMEFSTRA
jgi:hypothetical protein